MSPPGVDPLNEQLGMEAVQKETPPKINKERALQVSSEQQVWTCTSESNSASNRVKQVSKDKKVKGK